jgi:hypothetical protein
MAIKLRALIKHPSRLEAGTGLDVVKANGVYTVSLDFDDFTETAAIADATRTQVVLLTPGLTGSDPDIYERMDAADFVTASGGVPATREIISGAGLTGGGTLAADRTLAVGAGAGISVNADDVALDTASTRNTDHMSVTLTAGAGLTGGGDISASRSFAVGAGTGIAVNADDVALDTASTRNTDHASVTLTAGAGLTGGGDISASRSFAVGAGTGITVNADDVALDTASTRNTDHAAVTLTAGTGLTGGGNISANRSFALDTASTRNTDHAAVMLTAGNGLTGGGDISASRSFAVGAGVGIAVSTDDVALNINGLTEDVSPDGANDFVATYDASGTTHKKVKLSNLPSAGGAAASEPYVTIGNTAGLSAERALTAGNGIIITDGGAGSTVTIAADFATQAEMETGTSVVDVVSPGRQHFHPSACKFWVQFSGDGAAINASYNVTSLTDNGAGDYSVTIGADFSSVSWAGFVSAGISASYNSSMGAYAAGSILVRVWLSSTGALADPNGPVSAGGFGDQ